MGFALSNMALKSSAFEEDGVIPKKHTGEGENVSPPLFWENAPKETKSFALVAFDPDAPLVKKQGVGFTHWVLYNIPPEIHELKSGDSNYTQGVNEQGGEGYTGPMPPQGHGTHRYYFHLFALDKSPDLKPGLDYEKLLKKIEPHVIATNRLVGTYTR
ncbi:MAG: YbhB/YbcL family Raf kinase inhibitor-like protein [Bacillota bacterium]